MLKISGTSNNAAPCANRGFANARSARRKNLRTRRSDTSGADVLMRSLLPLGFDPRHRHTTSEFDGPKEDARFEGQGYRLPDPATNRGGISAKQVG
jgi:hypothetical protein